eukprot:3582885-Rhodomonas_salina.1
MARHNRVWAAGELVDRAPVAQQRADAVQVGGAGVAAHRDSRQPHRHRALRVEREPRRARSHRHCSTDAGEVHLAGADPINAQIAVHATDNRGSLHHRRGRDTVQRSAHNAIRYRKLDRHVKELREQDVDATVRRQEVGDRNRNVDRREVARDWRLGLDHHRLQLSWQQLILGHLQGRIDEGAVGQARPDLVGACRPCVAPVAHSCDVEAHDGPTRDCRAPHPLDLDLCPGHVCDCEEPVDSRHSLDQERVLQDHSIREPHSDLAVAGKRVHGTELHHGSAHSARNEVCGHHVRIVQRCRDDCREADNGVVHRDAGGSGDTRDHVSARRVADVERRVDLELGAGAVLAVLHAAELDPHNLSRRDVAPAFARNRHSRATDSAKQPPVDAIVQARQRSVRVDGEAGREGDLDQAVVEQRVVGAEREDRSALVARRVQLHLHVRSKHVRWLQDRPVRELAHGAPRGVACVIWLAAIQQHTARSPGANVKVASVP